MLTHAYWITDYLYYVCMPQFFLIYFADTWLFCQFARMMITKEEPSRSGEQASINHLNVTRIHDTIFFLSDI